MPVSRKRKPAQRSRSSAQPTPRTATSSSTPTPELVDPRWLFRALGLVFAVALLLSWGALCLLWYQGQWQLVLHPSRAFAQQPAAFTGRCKDVAFSPDVSGHPQLRGSLCSPLERTTQPSAIQLDASIPTVLILHGGSADSAGSILRTTTLLDAHLNVLLFDYRGYGFSVGPHPTEATMQEDAAAALRFLTDTQHIPTQHIVLYGEGLGASLAVQLAVQHSEIPAIILESPDGDLTDRVVRDAHSWLIPVRLLFHEDFPLAAPLRTLSTPKLLITHAAAASAAFTNAANPKVTVELPKDDDRAFVPAVQRFIDQYVHTNTP